MKSTSATFKQILANKTARKYLIKVDLTLANNTALHLTEDDIWEDSFGIETASSSTSSFDIGTAVIGQCKFTINNIDGDFDNYDFFNAEATVWLGLDGDKVSNVQQYYRMGVYTVDEPSVANGLISLTLLDNMWLFDVPFSEAGVTFTSSTTARSIIQTMCTHCGVTLATQSFHGYDFSITEAPEDTNEMNCREVLQYIAMIGCNFCYMDSTGALHIAWYNTSATSATTVTCDLNQNTSFGTEDIEITGVKFVINETAHRIGSNGYCLELENPFVNEDNVSDVLNSIWDVLENFTLRTFNVTTASDLSAEIGDRIKVKDYQGNYVYSWVTTNSFKLASHIMQCNAVPPNRTLIKRYSKEVKAAVEEARKQSKELISSYDESVQRLNQLVERSMGAFSDYEDSPNGGRIFYISNMPITKDPDTGICSFESGSIVWRMAGDVFSVSRDGGITWVNGYDPSTGELIVNVLSAIGIQAEWVRTGTLYVGGSTGGTEYPTIEVYDANDNLIVEINRNGITMHKGIISSPDYAEVSGATYSTTGMKLDVLNKILRSPYFSIDTNGAYFRGTIQITGDVEVSRGSFRPTDYYIATDFYLQFSQAEGYEGTGTVVIKRHNFVQEGGVWVETTSTVDTITLVDDTPELSTVLDHTCGQNGKDYYEFDITSSSIVTILAKDLSLAYVGTEGFRGFLQGIFEGYLKTNVGEIAGFRYGQGTGGTYAGENGGFVDADGYNFSMRDGFGRRNGALLRLYDNVFNLGNSDGHFVFFKSDSHGGGADGAAIHVDSNNLNIFKTDNNHVVTGSILWNDGTVYTNSRVTASTTDITAGSTQLPTGDIYLVYE
jgi:hypothetical protein